MLPADDAVTRLSFLGVLGIALGIACALVVLLLVVGVVVYLVWKTRQSREAAPLETPKAPKGETAFREGPLDGAGPR